VEKRKISWIRQVLLTIILLHAGFLLGRFPILKMEVIHSFETPVHLRTKRTIYPRRWQRNYRCGNGKPYIFSFRFALSDVILCANRMQISRTWSHVKPCAVPWNTFQRPLVATGVKHVSDLEFRVSESSLYYFPFTRRTCYQWWFWDCLIMPLSTIQTETSNTVNLCPVMFCKMRKIISGMLKMLIYVVRSPDTILKQLN
jgi:hypothetical protein